MRIIVLIQLITLITSSACAQYFHFSQINYTDQRINPAAVASSDYATLNFVHRHQMTGGDFNINSSYISVAYPLLNQKNGRRWSGVGVSLMNDRSGGIFNTQEATLTYAANIYLSSRQTFTLGVKGLYQQRKINLDGLYTGSQYIPDRGFDDGAFSGEAFEQLQNNFITLSFGMLWQATDRFNDRTAYASLSFFDLNKPNDSFLGDENELKGAVVAAFGFRAYQKGQLSIYPEMLYTSTYSNHVVNLGAIWEYDLNTTNKRDRQQLNIITKYVVGRSGILGIQFLKENFSVGFSYDFPIIIKNQGNVSTYEIGIQLRNLVETKLKSRQTKKRSYDKKRSAVVANKPVAKDSVAQQAVKKDTTLTKLSSIWLAKSLRAKQDSIATNVLAGKIYHDPVELEKIVLRFNFEFNSTNIDEESAKYLNEIAGILKDNERLSLSLIGHTDNIGSEKFNMRLSKQRAQVVKDYLTDQDIASERIDVDGKGMQEPLNDNSTEEQRTLNRRVELKIIYTP